MLTSQVAAPAKPSLLGLSRAEQEWAKKLFVSSRIAHLVTVLLTIPVLFLEGKPAYFLALLAVVSELVAWALCVLADQRHSLAEEGRRRALLADGLGAPLDTLALRDLHLRFGGYAQEHAAEHDDKEYYASNQSPGPDRLREAMQEAAFWSSHLYRESAKVAGFVAGFLLIAVLVALLVVVGTGFASASLAVARIGVLFLSFLVFSDIATHMLAWGDAAAKSNDVYLRLQANDLREMPVALAIFGDYSVATATTPPIPSIIYMRRHDRIDAAWRAGSHSTSSPLSTP